MSKDWSAEFDIDIVPYSSDFVLKSIEKQRISKANSKFNNSYRKSKDKTTVIRFDEITVIFYINSDQPPSFVRDGT